MLAKDLLDLVRSGMIFPVAFTFITPLIFLYAVTWFLESVLLLDLGFSLLFYAVMVGFFCTLLYSWLSNVDIMENYNSLPLSMPHAIRVKLILFAGFTLIVAVPYLLGVGLLKGEVHLLWLALAILFSVSAYVGAVVAYLTGLFTNSYLLDGRVLAQFAGLVVPVLVVETLLSFYYSIAPGKATIGILGIGLALILAAVILLRGLDGRWENVRFEVA